MHTNEPDALTGSIENLPPIPDSELDPDSENSTLITPGQVIHNSGNSANSSSQLASILTAIKEANFPRHDLQYLINAIRSEIWNLASSDLDSDSSTTFQNDTTTTNKRKVMRKSADAQDNVPVMSVYNQNKKLKHQIVFKKSSTPRKCDKNLPAGGPSAEALQQKQVSIAPSQNNAESNSGSQPTIQHPHKNIPPNTNRHAVNFQDAIKPPDIVVRNGQSWTEISALFSRNGINFTSAKSTLEGTKIKTASMTDYRKAIAALRDNGKPYHTFMPDCERDLHVVLRGAGLDLDRNEIHQDLIAQGFSPNKVIRMKHPRTKAEMPLVLVTLSRDDPKSRDIYNIIEVCRLLVTVEPLKQTSEIGQCFRCLLFGHSSTRCTAEPKCKTCAGPHDSRACQQPPSAPIKCANCGGPHRATYRGCEKAPKPRVIKTDPQAAKPQLQKSAQPTKANFPGLPKSNLPQAPHQPPNQGPSMAQALKTRPQPAQVAQPVQNQQNQQDMMATIQSFQEAIGTLASMFSNMAMIFNPNKQQ